MGDIPGLNYEPPVAIDRRTLPNWDARPEVGRYERDGRQDEYLWWSYEEDGEEGQTSTSPANAFYGRSEQRNRSAPEVLDALWGALELPGTASDYHYAISGAVESMWRRRHAAPDVFAAYEELCWLDIRLIETVPAVTRIEDFADDENASRMYVVPAFSNLLGLYTREGRLRRAAEVADIARRHGLTGPQLDDFDARRAALEAEDAG